MMALHLFLEHHMLPGEVVLLDFEEKAAILAFMEYQAAEEKKRQQKAKSKKRG